MKLTKMIYLASPYSYKGEGVSNTARKRVQDLRYRQITQIAGKLEEQWDYAFILPITMSHNTAKYMEKKSGEFAYWAQRDLTYISRCDEIWVVEMKDWNRSVGIAAEIEFAKKHHIKIAYVNPKTLKITYKSDALII